MAPAATRSGPPRVTVARVMCGGRRHRRRLVMNCLGARRRFSRLCRLCRRARRFTRAGSVEPGYARGEARVCSARRGRGDRRSGGIREIAASLRRAVRARFRPRSDISQSAQARRQVISSRGARARSARHRSSPRWPRDYLRMTARRHLLGCSATRRTPLRRPRNGRCRADHCLSRTRIARKPCLAEAALREFHRRPLGRPGRGRLQSQSESRHGTAVLRGRALDRA